MTQSLKMQCPSCTTLLDGLLPVTDRRPLRPNDFIVCDICGSVSQLGENMEPLKLDDDAFGELLVSNPAMHKAITVLQEFIKNRIAQN